MKSQIIVGSRRSKLALVQTNWVINELKKHYPTIDFRIEEMVTKGDKILDVTLSKVGGKGLFVSEVEQALVDKHIDFAIHSMKDVPAVIEEGLTIAAIPERESANDVFVFKEVHDFGDLPTQAIIGTSSLRRASQILAERPDLQIKFIRGNIDTRLRKLREEDFDAIILAQAGLSRMGWLEDDSLRIQTIPETICLPAVGQGALAIECREEDNDTKDILRSIHHAITANCVAAERAFLKTLNGGCEIPIAGYATQSGSKVSFKGLVGTPDGKTIWEAERVGEDADQIGTEAANELLEKGAGALIASLRDENV